MLWQTTFLLTYKYTLGSNYVKTSKKKAVVKIKNRQCCIVTKGNGSSSSLVKELKGYDEEAIRCAQHRFKCQELLEWDQPVTERVFLEEENWNKQKKPMLNICFDKVLTESLPLIQTKQPGFSPHIDSHQWHGAITQIWFDPTDMMSKRFWREKKAAFVITAEFAIATTS